MKSILDRVTLQLTPFTPGNRAEYQAFQVARKLQDTGALRHYLVLSEHHPFDLLIQAYRKAQTRTGKEFMHSFHKLAHQP